MATIEDKYNQVIKMTNLKQYYDRGFKGQGIVIANIEGTIGDEHGRNVKETILTYAPEASVISYNDIYDRSSISDGNGTLGFPLFVDWCIENKVNIVSSSLDWSCDKPEEQAALQKLYDAGIIFLNCAGNSDTERDFDRGVHASNIDKGVITVSGLFLSVGSTKYTWAGYNYGEIVDVVALGSGVPFKSYFDPKDSDYERLCEKYGRKYLWSSWSGTSAATPLVAAMFAVMMSANGLINSKNAMELIEKCSSPFVYKDRTYNQLNLPGLDKLLATAQEKEDKVEAPVVQPSTPVVDNSETSSWAKEARDELMKLGITDGTNPKKQITREEVWTMLYRLYNKI